jgi:hypothetical protein
MACIFFPHLSQEWAESTADSPQSQTLIAVEVNVVGSVVAAVVSVVEVVDVDVVVVVVVAVEVDVVVSVVAAVVASVVVPEDWSLVKEVRKK